MEAKIELKKPKLTRKQVETAAAEMWRVARTYYPAQIPIPDWEYASDASKRQARETVKAIAPMVQFDEMERTI